MMTEHYHGTPITPNHVILGLAGRNFCVSHAAPQQVALVHQIGQRVMLDNGAFTKWKQGRETDWPGYFKWTETWLEFPTTWAVIPDDIEAGSQEQDALIREWPHGPDQAAPVYHMDEPLDRLYRLLDGGWNRVCIGANGEFAAVSMTLGSAFARQMDQIWNGIAQRHRRTPRVHMFRGMQLSLGDWPFFSLDSADIGRNHNRKQNTARAMADRWDAAQCPPSWAGSANWTTGSLFEEAL
jgi:hypothetical protein